MLYSRWQRALFSDICDNGDNLLVLKSGCTAGVWIYLAGDQ